MMTRYNNSLLGSNFSLNVSESMYSPFKPPTIDIQLIDLSSLTSGQKTPPPKHAKTPGHHDPSKTKTTETAQKKTALRKKKSRSPQCPSHPSHQAFLVAVYVLLTDLPSKHLVAKSSLLEHTLLCLQRRAGSLLLRPKNVIRVVDGGCFLRGFRAFFCSGEGNKKQCHLFLLHIHGFFCQNII